MASYVKRVLVLREEAKDFSLPQKPISAILRAETEGVNLRLTLEAFNFPCGDKFLAVYDGENFEVFFIDKNEFYSCLNAKTGLSAGVFLRNENDNIMLCYGKTGSANNKKELEKLFFDRNNSTKSEFDYNDEQICEHNYFISGENERENDYYADSQKAYKDSEKQSFYKHQTGADETEYNSFQTEKIGYFLTIQNELGNIFSRGKRLKELEEVVADSYWVKIDYNENKHYVVGVIEKDGIPKYVCYGVPAKCGEPPEAVKGNSSFIPLSLFNLYGDGYYVMFQSALSGELIKPTPIFK